MSKMTILDELAAHARERVEAARSALPLREVRARAEDAESGGFRFENALKGEGISFICECKRSSPSKGVIAQEYPYLRIAHEYEEAGAECVSVLTEPKWFGGSAEHLREIASSISIPCIRKDFTVDEYMIYEAKLLGASAVLLICSILSDMQLGDYIGICDSLGLSALVETHDGDEARRALAAHARMVGVNNRNLKDFSVDTGNSGRIRGIIPPDVLFVSESGVKSADDIDALREMGADAVLVGETMMRAQDKRAKLRELKGAA